MGRGRDDLEFRAKMGAPQGITGHLTHVLAIASSFINRAENHSVPQIVKRLTAGG